MPVQSRDAEMMGRIVVWALVFAGVLLLWGYGEEKARRKCHELLKKDWGARVVGLVFVLAALAFGYMGAYSAFCNVLRNEHSFMYSAVAVYAPTFMAIIGVPLLILGSFSRVVMPMDPNNITVAHWIYSLILVFGPMIAVYIVEHWFAQHGYQMHNPLYPP